MSLAPLLKGRDIGAYEGTTIFSYHGRVPGRRTAAIAVKDYWRLFGLMMSSRKELFNIARDPGETKDLSGENEGKRKELQASLREHERRQRKPRQSIQHSSAATVVAIDRQKEELLKALTYIND